MVKKKYTPFGDELSPEVAFVQAANLLDHAGAWAVENCDAALMSNTAAGWMELAQRLGGHFEGSDEMELESEPKYQMGFSPNPKDEHGEDEDEYEPDEVPLIEPDEDV